MEILEAQGRIGGRVWDDTTMGVCVGRGAQIIIGGVNNPISIICEQVRHHTLHHTTVVEGGGGVL